MPAGARWPRPPHPADGRQLEDEPQPPRGDRAGAEAGLDARATASTTTRPSRSRCCRRSPTCARCRPWSTATSCALGYGAQDLSAARLRRLHRRDLRRACSPSSAAPTSRSGTPSGASTTARTTPSWPRRCRRRCRHGLTPILCVGEGLEVRTERQSRRAHARPARRRRWRASPPSRRAGVVVAYEPVWAIGTGEVATPRGRAGGLRRDPRRGWPSCTAATSPTAVRVLYGGSVKAANIAEIMAEPDVDGALVGGASLDPDELRGDLPSTSAGVAPPARRSPLRRPVRRARRAARTCADGRASPTLYAGPRDPVDPWSDTS